MLRTLTESWRWILLLTTALALSAPANAASAPQHGISLPWREGGQALVIGTLRKEQPLQVDPPVPARHFVEIESVVVGELEAGQTLPLTTAYAIGPMHGGIPLPIGEKALLVLGRNWISPPRDGGPEWSISGGGYDFMPDGLPFCRVGPETEAILSDVPRMIEIAALGFGESVDREALQREAVWEEWHKGQMRRDLVLGWIILLNRGDPADRAALLNFLAALVHDRTMPPECRLTADSYLASPQYNRPDYANNTPARTALLIELLAHPDLPEHERKQAERTLADLSRRLEAENAAAPQAE